MNYDMRLLIGDVAAVVKHLKRDKAISTASGSDLVTSQYFLVRRESVFRGEPIATARCTAWGTPLVKVKMPVLMIHGLNDTALLAAVQRVVAIWSPRHTFLVMSERVLRRDPIATARCTASDTSPFIDPRPVREVLSLLIGFFTR
jgi:hypothetical protein